MFDRSKLDITPASFQAANKLRRVVGQALNEKKISLGGDFDLDGLLQNDITGDLVGGIISPLLSVVNSEQVEGAIFECAKTARYNREKIDLDFFEKPENRELFFPIMMEVAKENLAPFFAGLGFGLSTIRSKIGITRKQK